MEERLSSGLYRWYFRQACGHGSLRKSKKWWSEATQEEVTVFFILFWGEGPSGSFLYQWKNTVNLTALAK